ncbi:Quercetin 2,3-dioxygenase [Emticicia aquatica]|uniref:Quercetin 2,3-dioxygenase n=2 Tax=Emticicia aquatica TaxID=1681835 RepID=A0ABN8ET12_9BACT|nr:Quercetin 2,3-dioxygenase [Emticicia aquatica]
MVKNFFKNFKKENMTQTEAIIYLSEQRGCTEFEEFRSFHTFNFDSYFNENKANFGRLWVCNDNTLAAGKSIKRKIEKNSEVWILPLIGGIELKNKDGYDDFFEAGKVLYFSALKGVEYEIINPYDSELINYLEIWIEKGNIVSSEIEQINIDIEKKNELLPIFSTEKQGAFIYFGKFDGRKDYTFILKNPTNTIFAFVIEGAFEFQNRLLHPRDGLALWHVKEVDFEALSNEAMILLLEIPT